MAEQIQNKRVYWYVEVSIQIGNNKCLDLGKKGYLLEQCWKVEIYIPEVRKKFCAVNCNICTTGSVALWSMTKT
jgi:hypothetical protein